MATERTVMSNLTECLHCGGALAPHPKTGILTCKYCRREYKDALDEFSYELKEIVSRRQMREFIQAEELCRELLAKHPESCEAWWQQMLSKLGVVYVNDGKEAKPTFFSYTYDEKERIVNSESYKNALKYAKSSQDRAFYESQGEVLDKLLSEFFDLVSKENSYDIFISFKKSEIVTDSEGRERTVDTDDYKKAEEIYQSLKDRYRVFFSPISIGTDTGIVGEKYEPRILKALQSAQAMILVGTTAQHIESNWVANEWRRYRYFTEKGLKRKDSLILAYIGNMPSLPPALREIQLPSVDMFKSSYLEELSVKLSFVKTSRGIKSHISEKKIARNFATDSANIGFGGGVDRIKITGKHNNKIEISASEERELEFAKQSMDAGKFSDAYLIYTGVIENHPECAKAYYGRFLAAVMGEKKSKRVSGGDYSALAAQDFSQMRRGGHASGESIDPSRVNKKALADFELAIEHASDPELAWEAVEALIGAVKKSSEWDYYKKFLPTLARYTDASHAKMLIDNMKGIVAELAEIRKYARCDEVIEEMKKFFFEENMEYNLSVIENHANLMLGVGDFKSAKKYYELLAAADKRASYYYGLLAARVGAYDLTKKSFTISPNPNDDASAKAPNKLDLDEIIERIYICAHDGDEADKRYIDRIEAVVLHQVRNNSGASRPFVDTVINCYVQLGEQEGAEVFAEKCANAYLYAKRFDLARIYFDELLHYNTENPRAHWGLLKCTMKAADDEELARHNKNLLTKREFLNARNCASGRLLEHYTAVYNGTYRMTESEKRALSGADYKSAVLTAEELTAKVLEGDSFNSQKSLTVTLGVLIALLGALPTIFAFFIAGNAFLIAKFLKAWGIGWFVIIAAALIALAVFAFKMANSTKYDGHKKTFSLEGVLFALSAVLVIFSLVYTYNSVPETVYVGSVEEFEMIPDIPSAAERNYTLTADLDFGGRYSSVWEIFTGYGKTFDGNGKKIKNITYIVDLGNPSFGRNYYNVGLFTSRAEGGVIRNLTLEHCSTTVPYNADCSKIGVLVGKNNGTVTNCHLVDCFVSAKDVYAITWHDPHEYSCLGGIAGINYGKIENSTFKRVNAEENKYGITYTQEYDRMYTDKEPEVGGICGYNKGGEVIGCESDID